MRLSLNALKGLKAEWVQAILLGVGTMAGAATFWYRDIHVPRTTPATLTITPTLETIGRQGDRLLVRATLKVENRSSYRVYVPAFWYSVYGECHQPRTISPDSFARVLRGWKAGGVHSRFNDPATGDLLAEGRPSPRKDTYYDSGSERRLEELFLVPDGQYSAVRMKVSYMVAKDIEEVDTTAWKMGANGEFADSVYLARRTHPWLPWSRATRRELYDRRTHVDWIRRARAGWVSSHATLSLWPLSTDGHSRATPACVRAEATSAAPARP
jgi:hypothetical protein